MPKAGGIGLATRKKIVGMHVGTIEAKTDGVKVIIFIVMLPIQTFRLRSSPKQSPDNQFFCGEYLLILF